MFIPCGAYASVSAISASRVSAIISCSSSAVAEASVAMWRLGITIR